MPYEHILSPGRHHLLTRFQAAYLELAVRVGVPDAAGAHCDCRAPIATLRPVGERERALPWPDTHLRLVARRPAA